MNIFCKETQAHLQLHPHLKEHAVASGQGRVAGAAGGPSSSSGSTLITPDLWMRDCRSESPESAKSQSPERLPSPIIEITTPTPGRDSPPSSPYLDDDMKPTNLTLSPKPKPPLSLENANHRMSKKINGLRARKGARSKRSSRISAPIVTPQVEVSAVNANINSSSPRSSNSGSPPKNPPPPTMIPPMPPYPLPPSHLLPPDHPLHRPPFLSPGFFPPPHVLAEFAARFPMPRHQMRKPHPPNTLPPLLPLNRHMHIPPPMNFPAPPQPPPPLPPSLLPPPTLMVPYPVLIPIPIPIPILIPIPPDFKLKEETQTDKSSDTNNEVEARIKVEVESPPPENPTLNLSSEQSPPRKRKRPEISSEEDVISKPKSVPA